MHRVIQATAFGTKTATEQQIKDIKNEISAELSSGSPANYDVFSSAVNDGVDDNNRYTIGVNIDFILAEEANTFNIWLKQKFTDNSSLLEYGRTRIHDCMHATDKNAPCLLGDVWSL